VCNCYCSLYVTKLYDTAEEVSVDMFHIQLSLNVIWICEMFKDVNVSMHIFVNLKCHPLS
jgi:hypothetical protein